MSNFDRDAFFTLHRDLPREGPGEPADIHWALGVTGTSGAARVLDAGCGPGADTVTLAGALPQARIEAIDTYAHFIEDARARTAEFGPRVTCRAGDMAQVTGPFDLIWCAGALYFLGVEQGLTTWAKALAPAGHVAFSHPVTQADDPPEVAQFWEGEPGVGPREMTEAAITKAGYRLLDYRRIEGPPWEAYYAPQEARIAQLRAEGVSDAVEAVLQMTEREIALWRARPDRIVYGLWVVAR